MKRFVILLLAALLCIGCALAEDTWDCAACGAADVSGLFCSWCGSPKPADTWRCTACGEDGNKGLFCSHCGTAKSVAEAAAPSQNAVRSAAMPLALGGRMEQTFVKLTVDRAEVATSLAQWGINCYADQGNTFLKLIGEIYNIGGYELLLNQVVGEVVVNGTYHYAASAYVVKGEMSTYNLPALDQGQLVILAQIPQTLAEMLNEATFTFGFNEGFARAASLDAAAYVYEVALDQEACAKAMKGPERKKVFFDECPILPKPESYTDLHESGSSKSSANGKITKIAYRYTSRDKNSSVKKMFETYISALKEEKYGVAVKSGTYTVTDAGKKLAEITLSGDTITVNVTPGNDKLKTRGKAGSSSSAEKKNTLKLGSSIKPKNAQVKLEKSGIADRLYSGINKSGRYYETEDGGRFFYVQGAFKNTGKKPVDIRNIYAQLEFNNGNKYPARVIGVRKGSSSFINTVNAGVSCSFYLYAEVPKSVLNSYKSCTVKIGFTDDFGIKFTKSELPDFSHCDNVYELKLTK